MSTTNTGRSAEQLASDELQKEGYKIIATNWRTRWCEIDIVAQKDRTVYFVEVRYRTSTYWGSGLDSITPKKLQQMQFAAEIWVSSNHWNGPVGLKVVSMSGIPPMFDTIVDV